MLTWSAIAVVSVLAGVGMGLIGLVVWYNHDGPGSTAFVVTMAGAFLTGAGYGLNLLSHDRAVSEALELPFWLGGELMVVGLVFFALAFTGRGEYLTRRNAVLVSAIPALTVLVVATNAYHGLFWAEYRIVETFGAGVRSFERGPWLYVKSTYAVVIVGVAYLLFLEEIYVEETLYRNQSIAIVAGSAIPLSGYTAWLFEIGPYPHLDFMATLLWGSVALYGYAVFRANLFETTPAVRRIGRRTAIDRLGEPVVILDDEAHITDLNEAATSLLAGERVELLGAPIDVALPDAGLDLEASTQSLSVRTVTGVRDFEVTVSEMVDQSEEVIGHTVLLHDVTDRRQREEYLSVLNRVLRHNLRNDLTVVEGRIELVAEQLSDEDQAAHLAEAKEMTEELLALAETARDIEDIVDAEVPVQSVDPAEIVASVVDDVAAAHPSAEITLTDGSGRPIETRPRLVTVALEQVLENAAMHGGEDPVVDVTVTETAEGLTVRVTDDGPGIDDHEVAALEGEESPLEHGSGLGLWLANWSMRQLGGTLTFEETDDGTTVVLAVPDLGERDQEPVAPAPVG